MECIDARAVGVGESGEPRQCWVSGLSTWRRVCGNRRVDPGILGVEC